LTEEQQKYQKMTARRSRCRRVIPETGGHSLDYLRDCFNLNPGGRTHQAQHDVGTVVEMIWNIYRPRLESAGLTTFDSVADFSRQTPVAECIDIIRQACKSTTRRTRL